MPLISSSRTPEVSNLEVDKFGAKTIEVAVDNANGVDTVGTGLQNEIGEYNCFLNVIIQVGLAR